MLAGIRRPAHPAQAPFGRSEEACLPLNLVVPRSCIPSGLLSVSLSNSPGISRLENKEETMRTLTLLAATAAIGAVSAPAAAQYYPAPTYPQQQNPYPGQTYPAPGYQQQGYGYPQQQQQGGIAGVIGQLLGNRYAVNDRTAITQCASAAQAQVAQQYGGGYGNRYGQYNQNNQGYAASRVTAITQVERRNRGLRVSGLIASGQAYNGRNGYNQQNGGADLSFRCNVDYNGAVTNLRVTRLARR